MDSYDYTVQNIDSKSALSQWAFSTSAPCETLVIPDGCRDFIVKVGSECDQSFFISDLSNSAYNVLSLPGVHMRGIRLHPGIQIHSQALGAWLIGGDLNKLFHSDQLDEFCHRPLGLAEALDCLALNHPTVQLVAKDLGVSMRSLQRLVKSYTGCSPSYWFSLARARKGARALYEHSSICEAACETGFADQAHMSREMKRWFMRTPKQITLDTECYRVLSETGYS